MLKSELRIKWNREKKRISDQNKSIYEQRIAEIKQLLENYELDAIIVNHDDEYLSYELNESQERIKYLFDVSKDNNFLYKSNFKPFVIFVPTQVER